VIGSRIPVVSSAAQRLTEFVLIFSLLCALRTDEWDLALRIARLANLAFRSHVRARRMPITSLYVEALLRARLHYRIVAEFPKAEQIEDPDLNYFVGTAHLYEGDPLFALFFFNRATELHQSHPYHRMKGRAYLMLGNEEAARPCFAQSVKMESKTVMAHMNYAGRYNTASYIPKAWELRDAGDLLIFDNYGQLAEDLMHLGYLSRGLQLYQRMLLKQQRYCYRLLPDAVVKRLAELSQCFDPAKPVRILGYEWVIQFGHIGYLDLYTKMALLGMYPEANHVLLAPQEKVTNEHLLAYWEPYFTIVRDPELVAELFPWQRILADGFNAYPGEGDQAEHWTRAAARAQIEWAAQARRPLLSISPEDRKAGTDLLAKVGVPDEAWYVGLHVREGNFYKEARGHMSLHRNADIEDYFPAINAITSRGGYVIRLGDSGMRPLPPMPGVIDYAHSPYKSPAADIFFCATSKFVIGTTSGLTNASLCFGTPMLVVNCISSDWQLWTADTDFILKRVWSAHEKRFLSLRETYSDPTQGYLMNAHIMHRHGLEAVPNNADDILKAVTYKLDKMDRRQKSKRDSELLDGYRRAIEENPPIFGAGQPVPQFLADYPELLGEYDVQGKRASCALEQ
jgi:putative glycosyltransferase (TIGR04372 family)